MFADRAVKAGVPRSRIELEVRSTNIGENLIHEMVGDVQRMTIDPGLGFQIAQDIPQDVASAYEQLVRLGYDRHLVGK